MNVQIVDLNPTDHPVTLAIRETCAGIDHPPAVWCDSLSLTFCHCGRHRYVERISYTAAIQRRNAWEPVRRALVTRSATPTDAAA